MNKNFATILTVAAIALTTGCVTAGTWVNGYYINGPLCTVCDGTKVVTHAYGTTVCTHCDGTGIEPPEETVIVENNVIMDTVVCDTWRPLLPPPRYHHPRPNVRRNPPHRGGGQHKARPARPAAPRGGGQHKARPARPAAPRGRGGRR